MSDLSSEPIENIKWNKKQANDLKLRVQATKLPPSKLITKQDDLPAGLDITLFRALLNGYQSTVPAVYIEYLYDLCRKEAKADQFIRSKRKTYIDIPKSKRQKILDEIERTGVSVYELLKYEGLKSINPQTVTQLAQGRQKTGAEADIDKVLELFARRSEKKKVAIKIGHQLKTDAYVVISRQDYQRLKYIQEHTGLLPGRIFALHEGATPEHLTPAMVSNWLNKENSKAEQAHVAWVLQACEAVLEKVLDILKSPD